MLDMHPTQLDHLALFVADRPGLSELLLERFDMHVIDQSDRFTLLGPSATAGKLTLFDAPEGSVPAAQQLASVLLYEPDATRRESIETGHGFTIETGVHPGVHTETPRHAFVGLTLRTTNPADDAARYAEEFGLELHDADPAIAEVGIGTGRIRLVREAWQ